MTSGVPQDTVLGLLFERRATRFVWGDYDTTSSVTTSMLENPSRTETIFQGYSVLQICVWLFLYSINIILEPYYGKSYKRTQHEGPCTSLIGECTHVFLLLEHTAGCLLFCTTFLSRTTHVQHNLKHSWDSERTPLTEEEPELANIK